MAVVDRLSPLASVSATREVLSRHGLATKKQLGQNFLINDDVLGKIVKLAGLTENDSVLEVGPGIGTLTIALLKSARCVVSVERDPDLPAVLSETCAPWKGSFRLISKDALDLSAADVRAELDSMDAPGFPGKFVANLPYAVAATIVLDFFERFSFEYGRRFSGGAGRRKRFILQRQRHREDALENRFVDSFEHPIRKRQRCKCRHRSRKMFGHLHALLPT